MAWKAKQWREEVGRTRKMRNIGERIMQNLGIIINIFIALLGELRLDVIITAPAAYEDF